MGEPFVKVFAEERELTALIAVDRSASQDAGLARQAKAEVAAEIAALLIFSALENGDRAGLLLFTDRIERYVPPRKGKKHGLRLITEALAFQPKGRGTDLGAALGHLTTAQRRRAVVFVVSDFLADGYESALAVLSRRHDVVPVVVSDPVEEKLPELRGLWPVIDAESGETALLDLSDARTRTAYALYARDRRDVYSLPSFDPAPLAVPAGTPPPRVRREEPAKDRAKTIFTLTLTDYGTLEPKLPDFTLHVTGPEGPRQLSVRGRPLKFR